jgi:nucleoside-diphosphate-sugar epimerase
MNNSILIFGKNSFVASGIEEVLSVEGYQVELFTRGKDGRCNNIISGKTSEIAKNKYFLDQYDAVINYVVLKDADIKENIEYIRALLTFCVQHKVKKLIHFSSIMVYNYAEKRVDEFTPIEPSNTTYKKGYGKIKISVDEYLLSVKDQYPFDIILVRPGYVLDENRACPFVKQLPLRLSLIKGNKKSKQPIVNKESIHKALLLILSISKNNSVYHFFPNNNQTKYQFAKEKFGGIIITLPTLIFKILPKMLTKMGVFPNFLYSRFEGMYIQTEYSSEKTEQKLQLKF